MKIKIKKVAGKPKKDVFQPVDVIIHLENKEEANGLRHLVGCIDDFAKCNSRSMALAVAAELQDAFIKDNQLVPLH